MPEQPNAGVIASLRLQNAGADTLAAGVTTLGHVFRMGDVPSGQGLAVRIDGALVPVQMDVKARHEDGSVKMATLAFERPPLAVGSTLEAALVRAPLPAPQPAVDLAAVSGRHAFVVELTPSGGSTITVDVLGALRAALKDGSASVWQRGPLATEARVEIDLPGSMRLKFDVTAFRDGQITVDAMFNNDQAMQAVGGRVQYDVVARLNGREVIRESVNHGQYQNWHRLIESSEANGGQGLGDASRGWLNIRHDIAYLKQTGAIANYDLSLAIPETTLSRYGAAINAPGWGAPLAANGVMQAMGAGGGRPDLGFTTEHNVNWLISGDARAGAYALGQAQASGSVPWNFWDAANGTWLNTDNYPRLWTDGRGGTGTPGNRMSTGLTQQVDSATGWGPTTSHQPDLSFVPYILTGERWILDNLNAQSAWSIMGTWPAPRRDGQDNVIDQAQVRSAAWSMRQIENAAWINPDGSTEQRYFRQASDDNWSWILRQIPSWTERQGEAHGWIPGVYTAGVLPPWQQDYFAGVAIIAAKRGNAGAAATLDWMSNFLVGRFTSEKLGFPQRDGVAYLIAISDAVTGRIYTTWAEIGRETIRNGLSNTTGKGWENSNGEYGRLGLATLAGLYDLKKDPAIAEIYRQVLGSGPPYTDQANYGRSPGYGVTIPDILDAIHPPPPPPPDLKPVAIDLGRGSDVLVLRIAQDFFEGSAQYTLAVNGQAVGGTLTASALRSSGGFDTVTVRGDWGGTITLSVTFLNDRWGGSAAADRNLYLVGATLNGKNAGLAADLFSTGTRSFSLDTGKPALGPPAQPPSLPVAQPPVQPPPVQPPPPQAPPLPVPAAAALREGDGGANTLAGGPGGDILRGRAGNDVKTGGPGPDTFILARGDGADRITDFVSGTDRLLFDGIDPGTLKARITTVGGKTGTLITYGPGGDSVFLENVTSLRQGDLVFANVPPPTPAQAPSQGPAQASALVPPAPPPPGFAPVSLFAGSGPDTIVLSIAQDAWRGSALYTVSVDGRQVGGIFAASALKSSGLADTLTLRGDWGSAAVVTVRFLNDAGGGTPQTDRNLYVEGISFNGNALVGMKGAVAGTQPMSFAITEPVTPKVLSFGSGPDSLVLRIAQDFWQGPAEYAIAINGQPVTGTLTAAAVRANGQADTVTIRGRWGESVDVSLRFLNDAWGGSPTADRNLHLVGASLNGNDLGVSFALSQTGAQGFTALRAVALPAPAFAVLQEGGSGGERLAGGPGNDILRGRAGNDVLTGGAGQDTFILARGDGADQITDFVSGTDRLFFQGIDPASVKAVLTTVGGASWLLLTYGPAGDSVFLGGVSSLAPGDLVFG